MPLNIIEGGLYAIEQENGTFKIYKILVLEEHITHIRIYTNRFAEIPLDVDPEILHCGIDMNNLDDIGIGHLPLARVGFEEENPIFLKQMPVTEDELEGYYYWLNDED